MVLPFKTIMLGTGLFVLQYIYLELHKCTVTSVSELAHSWGVFQYTVWSLVIIYISYQVVIIILM